MRFLVLALLLTLIGCTSPSKNKKLTTIVYTEYGSAAYSKESRDKYFSILKKTGANMASVLMTCQTKDKLSSEIDCDSENSPTQARLNAFFAQAQELGYQTSLRVYVDLLDGSWRALWDPKDKKKTFKNLQAVLERYGRYAAKKQIDLFIIGAEYEKLTQPTYESQWTNIIKAVRQNYSGAITYGANGNYSSYKKPEYAWVPFWSQLDFVGIDHYAPFTGKPASLINLTKHHKKFIKKYREATKQAAKPLFFSEVGFPTAAKGHQKPYEWKWTKTDPLDLSQQGTNILAFLTASSENQSVEGVAIWRYMSNQSKVYHGGYDLKHEAAASALKKGFRSMQ